MKLVPANHASEKRVDHFLNNHKTIEKSGLLQTGYVVEINGKITGCFVLEPIKEGLYWLKQLYITNTEAIALPTLVEAILVLAEQKQAKKVYVHSHKLMVDIILQSLQFRPQKNPSFPNEHSKSAGKWWSYDILS